MSQRLGSGVCTQVLVLEDSRNRTQGRWGGVEAEVGMGYGRSDAGTRCQVGMGGCLMTHSYPGS